MITHQRERQEFNRVFYELSALILSVIRSPPSLEFSSVEENPATQRWPPMSPGGFAAMLLGVSMAMMLCGSVTFFIGFVLMPWVIGLVMVLYVVGVLSGLSMIGRAIISFSTASPSLSRK